MRNYTKSPMVMNPHTKLGKGASLPTGSLADFFSYVVFYGIVGAVIMAIVFLGCNAIAKQSLTSAQEECAKYDYCAEYVELAGV